VLAPLVPQDSQIPLRIARKVSAVNFHSFDR
jgi:hypothetical protein